MQAAVAEEAAMAAAAEIAPVVVEEAAMAAVVAALLEELVTAEMAVLQVVAVREEPVTEGTVVAVQEHLVFKVPHLLPSACEAFQVWRFCSVLCE